MAPIRTRTWALLLCLSACNCDEGPLVGGSSTLAAGEMKLDFGDVFLGNSGRLTFLLSAPGEIPVEYASAFDGDALGYMAGPAVGVITANGAVEIVVTFRPIVAGQRNAKLIFFSDARTNSSVIVELLGNGVTPPDCEDGNGCTTDAFNLETGRCEHAVADLPCDDFDACTVEDRCSDGTCRGKSRSCDDQSICTDDLCNPRTGCENPLVATCSDGNPCTADTCDPFTGCSNVDLPNGTPCDDLEQCTIADICLEGHCIGVSVPEGTVCDDLDPCSMNDQCLEGTCLDPTYTRPLFGDLKFVTDVGALEEGAATNPIVDRDGTVYVGIEDGVAAVDECGELLWLNEGLPGTRTSGAVSLPGVLTIPVKSYIADLDTASGALARSLDLSSLFPPSSSTTATTTIRVLDLALRGSGVVLASVVSETKSTGSETLQGLIAEIDREHTIATPFRDLGDRFASRIAVDADEAVIAIVSDGRPDKGVHDEQVVRFGIDGLPETSWSSSSILAGHTEIALGPDSEVFWTAGLLALERSGALRALRPPPSDPLLLDRGAPVIKGGDVVFIEARSRMVPTGPGLTGDPSYHLVSADRLSGEERWSYDLSAPAARMSPVVDVQENVFVASSDGLLYAFTGDGTFLFSFALPVGLGDLSGAALTLTPRNVVIAIGAGRVFGIQSLATLGNSSWPRHRRDNLSTGHR